MNNHTVKQINILTDELRKRCKSQSEMTSKLAKGQSHRQIMVSDGIEHGYTTVESYEEYLHKRIKTIIKEIAELYFMEAKSKTITQEMMDKL